MRHVCAEFDNMQQRAADAANALGVSLDGRLRIYFDLLFSHQNELLEGNTGPFNLSLGRRFTQFCLRNNDDESPFLIGDAFKSFKIQSIVISVWWSAFSAASEIASQIQP